MECSRVIVETGARLHGGFHILPGARQEWASLGFYIATPRVRLELETLEGGGPVVEGPQDSARPVRRALDLLGNPGVRVRIREAIPRHVGLGSTTQLVLAALAGALTLETGRPPTRSTLQRHALRAGRGRFSLVGTLLFTYGGFIITPPAPARPPVVPVYHSTLPRDWVFVVVLPKLGRGLPEGEAEGRLMRSLPPAGEALRRRGAVGVHRMIVSLATGDLEGFLEGLEIVQTTTGLYFQRVQGGVYRRDLAAIADEARRDGIILAQSSWGPTMYTITRRRDAPSDAKTLRMIARLEGVDAEVRVVEPRGLPAVVECRAS